MPHIGYDYISKSNTPETVL